MKPTGVRPISTELKLRAEDELGETSERVEKDLEQFKEWTKKVDYLTCRQDDQFLIAFLRGSKFSIEKAKQKLELYYKRKIVAPEIFPTGKATNPRIIEILRLG